LHRFIHEEPITVLREAWNSQIFEAGLETQNYDKDFERFVRKFHPDQGMESVIAIVKGVHHEHGTEIYFTQEKRRHLLLDTLYGLIDEEALWYTLHSWAKFRPRTNRPRQEPGQLFYPAFYSHVLEKYWDTLNKPQDHEEFSNESEFTQAYMREFSAGLGRTDTSNFTPLVGGEAKQSHVKTAQEAAISRLCPIQDAYDFWNMGRSSPDTGSGGSAPG
jgi:hypothetical protein